MFLVSLFVPAFFVPFLGNRQTALFHEMRHPPYQGIQADMLEPAMPESSTDR